MKLVFVGIMSKPEAVLSLWYLQGLVIVYGGGGALRMIYVKINFQKAHKSINYRSLKKLKYFKIQFMNLSLNSVMKTLLAV